MDQVNAGLLLDSEAVNVGLLANVVSCTTLPRDAVSGDTAATTTGTVIGVKAICVRQGTFSTIQIAAGATAPATSTQAKLGVWDQNGVLLSDTADFSGALPAANAVKSIALTNTVTLSLGQIVYLGCAFVGGTQPTLKGQATNTGTTAVQAAAAQNGILAKSRSATGYASGTLPTLNVVGGSGGLVPWLEITG